MDVNVGVKEGVRVRIAVTLGVEIDGVIVSFALIGEGVGVLCAILQPFAIQTPSTSRQTITMPAAANSL